MASVCPLGANAVRLCVRTSDLSKSLNCYPDMDDMNEYKRHRYSDERPNFYPKEPENCDHPEEARQEVIDNIGEVAGKHEPFIECTRCGARLEDNEA